MDNLTREFIVRMAVEDVYAVRLSVDTTRLYRCSDGRRVAGYRHVQWPVALEYLQQCNNGYTVYVLAQPLPEWLELAKVQALLGGI